MFRKIIVGCSALAVLGGCSTINQPRTLETGSPPTAAVFIDAKQRAFYAVPKDGSTVCAEPSPDALSALATSGKLNLTSRDDLSLSQAISVAESAGSIGLRTQSIQLMRDAMYRLCEGYASGALTHGAYETLHRRLQSSMVAVLAIEQLTGAVRAQQVVLGGSAGTAAAGNIEEITTKTNTALDDLRTAEKARDDAKASYASLDDEYQKAQAAADGAADSEKEAKAKEAADLKTKRDQQKAQLDDLEKKAADRAAAYQRIDQARRAALEGSTAASTTGTLSAASDTRLDSNSVTAVSQAVEDIVNGALGLQFSNELCTTILVGEAYKEVDAADGVVTECRTLLQATKNRQDALTSLSNAAVLYLTKHPDMSPAEAANLIRAISDVKGPLLFTQ